MTQKTWTDLLGIPQPGTRYEVHGHDIGATTDGVRYRRLWTFDNPQHAHVVLARWLQGGA